MSQSDTGIRARLMAAQHASAGEIAERLSIPACLAEQIVNDYAAHKERLRRVKEASQ